MKVSDYIISELERRGVRHVFELSGGMIAHLLDSLAKQKTINVVSMRHEQGAAFAADATGRMTGIPGVAMATSGPGATNLLTGIGSCYFDSSPAVFITGQVNRNEQKGLRAIRQLGFQETDIVSMAAPITKAAWRVTSPVEVPGLLERAFTLAKSGRPGPVLIDVPMDIQRADIPTPQMSKPTTGDSVKIDASVWNNLFQSLAQAKRPLILAGGGIRAAGAIDLFRSVARKMRVPVANSLMAVDVLPFNDPLRIGMIGSYGNRWTNLAIARSDFLLVLGSRLDIRQTGSQTDAFKGERKIFHVDCETGEINNRVAGCCAIVSGLREFLSGASGAIEDREFQPREEWQAEIESLRSSWPDTQELAGTSGINPNILMHELSKTSGETSAYVVDVGQHQMWAAQSLELNSDQRFLTSGGMGSMGFALPAAIGAAFSAAPKPVVMIAGDGGFQSNIQELQTVAHHGLAMKMLVLNNGCHGMVRQFQQSYFDERYQSTLWGYSAPDFAQVANAYNIPSRTVVDSEDVKESLQWLWSSNGPSLLQVMIDMYANAYPKIAFGSPISEMEPFAKPTEMEST